MIEEHSDPERVEIVMRMVKEGEQVAGKENGEVNGGVNGEVNGGVNALTISQRQVFDIVNENPGLKTKQIAEVLNKSPRTIEKHLSFLAKVSLIEHRDSDKTGGYYVKK